MLSVICPNCGKESPETTSFCTGCGTRLEKSPVEAVCTVSATEISTPNEAAPAAETPAQTEAAPAMEIPSQTEAPTAAEATVATVPSTPLRRTPTWWKVLRCFFSIPLTTVLTVLLVCVIALYGLQHITRADTLETMIKDMNITSIVAEEISRGKTDSLAEALYDEYYEAAVNSNADIVLSEDELEEFFEESTIQDFVAEKSADFLSSFLNGETDAKITKEEIVDLIEDNEKVVEKITGGQTLSDNDYAMIEEFIEKENLVEQFDMTKMGLDTGLAEDLSLVRTSYSTVFWLLIGACLFVLLLIALFNLLGHFLTALYSGIALLVAGGIGALSLAAQSAILSMARAEMSNTEMNIITPLVDTIFRGFWIAGLVAMAAGTLCIILFAIMRIVGRKKRV